MKNGNDIKKIYLLNWIKRANDKTRYYNITIDHKNLLNLFESLK
jgi:hypothetical protein